MSEVTDYWQPEVERLSGIIRKQEAEIARLKQESAGLTEEDWNRISGELFTMRHRRSDCFSGQPNMSIPSHYEAIEETIRAMRVLGYEVRRRL